MILARNGILAVLFFLSTRVATHARFAPVKHRNNGGPGECSRAFTIIELLVTIAVIGVLVAVLIPGLRLVRHHARVTASLSNLRQHAAVFSTYAQDFQDRFPYFTVAAPGEASPIRLPGGKVVKVHYFSAYYLWPYALAPAYYGNNAASKSFTTPLRVEVADGNGAYFYPCTFLADPGYWRGETRTFPPAQLRPIRMADVAYPDSKAVMVDGASWRVPGGGEARTLAGCVDGHGEGVAQHRVARQYATGDGATLPFREYTRHFGSDVPFLHTLGGAAERDFAGP